METPFSKLLDRFNGVRSTAYALGDKELLHSDPYADNFFEDVKRNTIVPFDPAKAVKADMSLEEADARMNLLWLSKLFLLETDWQTKIRYVEQTVDRLKPEEKGLASRLNTYPIEQREYFRRNPLPKGNILDIYFREDVREVVQGTLSR